MIADIERGQSPLMSGRWLFTGFSGRIMEHSKPSSNLCCVVSLNGSSSRQQSESFQDAPDVGELPTMILEMIHDSVELQKHDDRAVAEIGHTLEAKLRRALKTMLAAVDQLAEVA